MPQNNQTKLVILGGGAAGLMVAMQLAKTKYLEITLIDSKSFYEYTPALCSVLFEPTDKAFERHFDSITFDYAPYLASLKIKFILGKIASVKEGKVNLVGQSQAVEYDYAVICTGSSYADPWKTAPSEDGNTLDAAARLDFLRQHRQNYQASQDILCIGGGPVGVETATEIACRSPTKKITLIDSNETVLASAPANLGQHAQTIIDAKPSIRSIHNERAYEKGKRGDKSIYETNQSHTIIDAHLVYNCIGTTPNSTFLDGAWLDNKKQVIVDDTLKVHGTANLFAVGDVNSVREPKMFYTAHMQAVHFAKNMRRILKNTAREELLLPYQGSKINMVVSLGPSHAVAHVSGINLTGWPFGTKHGSRIAALTKYFIERITMDDLGLKIPVNKLLYYTQEKGHGGLHLHSS
ncbi:hypothetical protein BD408DRAFT_441885 [Parasitella parasitica]|nr:hypothetical protein BD408DRAFT_441885 [Parasitella parasitica]